MKALTNQRNGKLVLGITLAATLAMISPPSEAATVGPGVSGGGNSCLQRIFEVNGVLALALKSGGLKNFRERIDIDLVPVIENATIELGRDLHLDGIKVDAINTPGERRIQVDEQICYRQSYSEFYESMTGLLLHEHLGLAGIDDTGYRVSREALGEARAALSSLFKLEASENTCGATSLEIERNKLLARIQLHIKRYENRITQYAKREEAISPALFRSWLIAEFNSDSIMRDQVGDVVRQLTENGRNGSNMTTAWTRKGPYCEFFSISQKNLSVSFKKQLDSQTNRYLAVIRTTDGFHGGFTIVDLKFHFDAKIEYFPPTKAYMVTVVGYPTLDSVDEVECEIVGSGDTGRRLPEQCNETLAAMHVKK